MDGIISGLAKIDNILWIVVMAVIFIAALVLVYLAAYYVIKAPNKGEALFYTVGLMGLVIVGVVAYPQALLIATNYSMTVSLPEAVKIQQNMGLWWEAFYNEGGTPQPTILPVDPTAVYIITTTPQPPPQPSPTWNYPTITPWATATTSIVTVTPLPTVKPTIDCATWNPSTPPPLPGEATSCSAGGN